jgi:hypothetical protein
MEHLGIFYGNLVYFTAIWDILWPLVIFYGFLVYFSRSGMLHQEKSGNPVLEYIPIDRRSDVHHF